MTVVDRDGKKPDAVGDSEGPGGRPEPAPQPPRPGHDRPPSDGDAIAELGDELGGPA